MIFDSDFRWAIAQRLISPPSTYQVLVQESSGSKRCPAIAAYLSDLLPLVPVEDVSQEAGRSNLSWASELSDRLIGF
ncbi:hypothetical protein H6F90_27790 [Trichocoleus sp. FACHB-591]|uniref:hypothetical protein n=1 Tax=Trichocoleus sp. FACHB-591 TaxID=2692872 RepID=UPI00168854B0|nr:hypothetical protein [Trichocoleus sp. FACHB-591]MBD2098869.1 hypothetical protein [Trichocoleus sp. FACHB-591]